MTTTRTQKVPNILIVDDMPSNLQLLAGMFTQRGCHARTFLDGELALQAARIETPDLILLDIAMPVMNGYEVCEQLKADAALKDIPVIFISALHETIDKLKAFSVGGVDFVTKPFQFAEVHARVETQLRIRSLQRQLSEQNGHLEQLVAERTRDLAKAYERLRESGRLKDDFLSMISHELRTSASGVLGIGHLAINLCQLSPEHTVYAALFEQSSMRLLNLIEDATLISNIGQITRMGGAATSFPDILAEVAASLPDIRISIEPSTNLRMFLLKGYPPLLKRALETMVLLASSFSRNKHAVHGTVTAGERDLHILLELDALSLAEEQAEAFFRIESNVRSLSSAESLGLAPVVARQILAAFGGELRLVKGKRDTGCLAVTLSGELNPV